MGVLAALQGDDEGGGGEAPGGDIRTTSAVLHADDDDADTSERRNEGHTAAAVGFFNNETAEAFTALFLERHAGNVNHTASGGGGAVASPACSERPSGVRRCRTDLFLRPAPVPGSTLEGGFTRVPEGSDFKAGDVLYQRTAYSVAPFREADGGESARRLRETRQALLWPLRVERVEVDDFLMAWRDAERAAIAAAGPTGVELAQEGQLARATEGLGRTAALKANCWAAAAAVHDGQFKHGPGVVSLGLIDELLLHDVEMFGAGEECGGAAATVEVVLIMPTRGRPMYMTIGLEIEAALLAVPGVRTVTVRCNWEEDAAWTARSMDAEAHEAIFGRTDGLARL
jgi:metal-sulfur cluster biosynthetic enzyme